MAHHYTESVIINHTSFRYVLKMLKGTITCMHQITIIISVSFAVGCIHTISIVTQRKLEIRTAYFDIHRHILIIFGRGIGIEQ